MNKKNFSSIENEDIPEDLIDILEAIREKKIYGSVEIFFEAGEVTQITQRIINKVPRGKKEEVKKTKLNNKEENPYLGKRNGTPVRDPLIVNPLQQ